MINNVLVEHTADCSHYLSAPRKIVLADECESAHVQERHVRIVVPSQVLFVQLSRMQYHIGQDRSTCLVDFGVTGQILLCTKDGPSQETIDLVIFFGGHQARAILSLEQL